MSKTYLESIFDLSHEHPWTKNILAQRKETHDLQWIKEAKEREDEREKKEILEENKIYEGRQQIEILNTEIQNCNKCFQEKSNFPAVFTPYTMPQIKHPFILFISDYPKEEEEFKSKKPLSGEREMILKKMVKAMNLEEDQYHHLFSFQCPCPNEKVKIDFASQCRDFLLRWIFLLKPSVIITFGSYATENLRQKKERLASIHGEFLEEKLRYKKEEMKVTIVPIFSLDYLQVNPNMKRTAWEDLKKVINHDFKA